MSSKNFKVDRTNRRNKMPLKQRKTSVAQQVANPAQAQKPQ